MNGKGNGNTRKDVFMVVAGKNGGKGAWVKVGTAFKNEDNTHILLNAFPMSGELYIFDSTEGSRSADPAAGAPAEAALK